MLVPRRRPAPDGGKEGGSQPTASSVLNRVRQACSSAGFPSSLDQAFVLSMRTNPDPDKTFAVLNGERSVMQTNAGQPQLTNFLQLQRGMVRIGFEQGIVLARQILYVF